MRNAFNKLFPLVLVAACLPLRAAAADFFFHDGDRVVFLGDSITEQRLYTTYIEGYTLARFPKWKITFRNAGWGGDTSWLRRRANSDEAKLFAAGDAEQQQMVQNSVGFGLSRDVLPLRPTAVTVDFGMNDHAYQAFRPDIFKAYIRSQTQIDTVLKGNGARVAFLTPQPIEDKRAHPEKDPRNISLRKFSDGLRDLAAQKNDVFADQFDPFMDIIKRTHATNADVLIGAGNAVHPGPPGHTLMAWAILKGLSAPALVSKAAIDSAAKKTTAEDACSVKNLTVDGGNVSFDRLDDALPMPIDAAAEPALRLAPVLDELSQYELQVTGLTTGEYALTIDGEAAGKASADDLAKGWNLSASAGPITKQGRELLKQVVEKNNFYYNRWRSVQLYQFPPWAQQPEIESRRTAELERLDREIASKENLIDQLRQPQSHHFELKPAH